MGLKLGAIGFGGRRGGGMSLLPPLLGEPQVDRKLKQGEIIIWLGKRYFVDRFVMPGRKPFVFELSPFGQKDTLVGNANTLWELEELIGARKPLVLSR